ncbi:hypothetical protein B1H18_09510 [Streptomyces tsukubensis]|uniref:DUF4244 domain-containing protein n=1 Tax=Streptomyces tsukubensis TaxID=83656 RepID=A0A1V4ACI0_9ACTN|nr:hypothetical protein B1H18_09510 [Streptomyces tsukubensis]
MWSRSWLGARVAKGSGAARDAGVVTSEYAMALLAAVGFAAVLYKIVTGGAVRAALESLVGRALGG